MRRLIIIVFLGIFLTTYTVCPLWAGEVESLIDKLIEKRVLTKEEAQELREDTHKGSGKKKGLDLRVYWDKGIRFQSADKAFALKLGGRIMNDWAFMNEDQGIRTTVGVLQDATTEFRRARLYVSGNLYNKVIFKAQYDFAGGDADFKDMYMGLKKLPCVGTLKVGHFKEPFGLEELTSSKYITFMERGLPGVFTPSRNTGIGVFKAELDDRLTWAFGTFLDTDSYGDDDGAKSNIAVTARITGLPWYEGKDKLLHLGLGYSYRDAKDNTHRLRERPEAHLVSRFVDTGSINANLENRFGLEAAFVCGPFSLQGEYMGTVVDARNMSDPYFSGYYVYASYFLTGEHRVYKKSGGVFDRVKPRKDFVRASGMGAWEIAFRYSGLDLTDEAIQGGELEDISFGINWYLNPNLRAMFNYVRADLDGVGNANIFQMRFQIDF
ncbi:MAG: porin [Thermodesulfobacteriota bacterium]|nr:porin [Thermodesulfobacteriota bacterium]